jgi:hypothetical protein
MLGPKCCSCYYRKPARDLLVHQLIIADSALCDSKIPRVPGRYPLAGHDVDSQH